MKAAQTSERTIAQARQILASGVPALVKAVVQGKVSLRAAAEVAKHPTRPGGQRHCATNPDLGEPLARSHRPLVWYSQRYTIGHLCAHMCYIHSCSVSICLAHQGRDIGVFSALDFDGNGGHERLG